MKAQDIFDTVLTHLRKQGKPSMDIVQGDARCLYRGPGGTSCAIGCLMPDELYDADKMEHRGISEFIDIFPPEFHEHQTLLSDLQGAHDHNSSMHDGGTSTVINKDWLRTMEKNMSYIAEDFDLVYNEV